MNNRPVWTHTENLQAAIEAAKDPRAVVVAMTLLGRHAPEGVGAFAYDPASMAATVSARRDPIAAADIEAMREDLLLFFVELPDGRWAPSPAIFVANDPYSEKPD